MRRQNSFQFFCSVLWKDNVKLLRLPTCIINTTSPIIQKMLNHKYCSYVMYVKTEATLGFFGKKWRVIHAHLLQPQMAHFGWQHWVITTQDRKLFITQSKLIDKIKRSWKLIISSCDFQKKMELDFGCGPCWPCFCLRRVLIDLF